MPDTHSAAASPPPASEPLAKLKETDVQYLALEGGGGKGFAFLGVIDMLERKEVMPRVRGFAGASAGAITALLLSVGYDFAALEKFLATTNFDDFYDPPEPRVRPVVGSFAGEPVTDPTRAEIAFMEGDVAEWTRTLIEGDHPTFARMAAADAIVGGAARLAQLVAQQKASGILALLLQLDLPPVAKALLGEGHLMKYLAFLPRDMGLFSGAAARILLEGILREAAVKKKGGLPSTYANMSFDTHWKTFGKELLVTGTNLRSGKTQLFSRTATPYFPVADAVRISMGLPWVFKPYVITRQGDDKDPPCGVYVDGGVWNNLPFREFDSPPPEKKKTRSSAAAGGGQRGSTGPRTLGLRLEITPLASIDSVAALTGQMLGHGVMGSGESQVLDKYTAQCVVLDTRGLSLLEFSPPKDKAVRDRIANRSRRAICRYFDWPIEAVIPSIVDDDDDRATEQARQAAIKC
jgi:predicted acylesterase/phospholipase RssA